MYYLLKERKGGDGIFFFFFFQLFSPRFARASHVCNLILDAVLLVGFWVMMATKTVSQSVCWNGMMISLDARAEVSMRSICTRNPPC